MAEHTPTPWRLGYADGDRAFVNGGSVTVCKSDRTLNECDPNANAEFIVRCVNSHDDLLAELRHLVQLLEPLEQDGSLRVPGVATLNGARAAIAKAEGRQ